MLKMKSLLSGLLIIVSMLISNQVLADEAKDQSNTQTLTTNQSAVISKEVSNKDISEPILLGDKININTASANEIQQALTGIGKKKAMAIVDYRNEHGNFTSIEQLTEVKGIGKATLEKNKGKISL